MSNALFAGTRHIGVEHTEVLPVSNCLAAHNEPPVRIGARRAVQPWTQDERGILLVKFTADGGKLTKKETMAHELSDSKGAVSCADAVYAVIFVVIPSPSGAPCRDEVAMSQQGQGFVSLRMSPPVPGFAETPALFKGSFASARCAGVTQTLSPGVASRQT